MTLEIANVRRVETGSKEEVVVEFHQIAIPQEYISQGGISYAKEVLECALWATKVNGHH